LTTVLEVTAATFGPNTRGGGERHATEFASELQKHAEVFLSSVGTLPEQYTFANFVSIPGVALRLSPLLVPSNPVPSLLAPSRIGTWLRAHGRDVDFIHVHNHRTIVGSMWTLLAAMNRSGPRPKLVLTDHNSRFIPIGATLTKLFDYYAPVSSASARYLNRIAERPTCVVKTAVSELFVNQPPPLGFSERPIGLLFVGRLVPWKAPDRLINIARILKEKFDTRLSVLIVGAVSDFSYYARLRSLIEKAGLQSQVDLVVNPSDDRVLTYYRKSRLQCLLARSNPKHETSPSELSPITLLEAASAGTPSLVPPARPISDEVVESGLGVVATSDSDLVLAQRAYQVLNDEGEWRRLSLAARTHILAERTYPIIVKKFLTFLTGVNT
jgi:glycosyltransferase involved in cell wall biosynthesis